MREDRACMVFLVGLAMLLGSLGGILSDSLWAADPATSNAPSPKADEPGYLENIAFKNPMPGKERIVISVSRLTNATAEIQGQNSLLLKLENTFVPQEYRHPFADSVLHNVLRVVPVQQTVAGKQWAYVTIDLKERVPYSLRQQGNDVLLDFNVAGLAQRSKAPGQKSSALPERAGAPRERQDAAVSKLQLDQRKDYTGHRISLDFQDANIKSVFRLLAELAKVNIVSGDDVKGNVTIHMKDVPWDQALDTILSINGLGKRQVGNVITVMTLEKIKKDEADRQEALAAQRKAQEEMEKPPEEPQVTRVVNIDYTDANKLTENLVEMLKDKDGKATGSVKVDENSNSLIIQAARQDMNRLLPLIETLDKPTPQVQIKANIVETTKDTARNLGIQWGGIFGHSVGDQALFITPGGTGGSAVPPGTVFPGGFTPTSGVTGISGQGFGVNFPAAFSGTASASLGLIFGTIGSNVLELQLNALQRDGKLNILSSPSITTLDNQKAFTENGETIPYVTQETAGGVVTNTVKFQDAVLRLEITPHVVDGQQLKMKIVVKKDEVDNSRRVGDNPFIIKKQTETNLIVQDGGTIVISGLTKHRSTENVTGVPWLKEIPIFGWLFKGEEKTQSMEEVLIFITPKILKPQALAGIQEGP